jgi:hypothetical protein
MKTLLKTQDRLPLVTSISAERATGRGFIV